MYYKENTSVKKIKHCVLLLDDWGTPPSQNIWLNFTNLVQYVVPWNFEYNQNFLLGHYLNVNSHTFKLFLTQKVKPLLQVYTYMYV